MTPRTRQASAVLAPTLLALLLLGGCASKNTPPPLYGWEGYEKNIDSYFRPDRQSLNAQAQLMEADMQKIRAANQAMPPGFQAHLGLLYGKQGDMQRFEQHLQAEKQQFPEGGGFIDFLLRSFTKK